MKSPRSGYDTEQVCFDHEIGEGTEYVYLEFDVEVGIEWAKPWQGSAHSAPSDMDYYGYTMIDYTKITAVRASDEDGKDIPVPDKYNKVGSDFRDLGLKDDDQILDQLQ